MITILTLIDIKNPVRAPTSGAMVGDKTATLTQNIRTVKNCTFLMSSRKNDKNTCSRHCTATANH